MNIAEFRKKRPDYNDMSDAQLVEKLHKKFYADMSFDEFSAKVIGQSAGNKQGPWEKYQPQYQEQTGPWDKYKTENQSGRGLKENVKRMIAAGVPEQEIGTYIQKYSGQSRPDQPATELPWSEAISEGIRKLPESVLDEIVATGKAVMHPIDTLKSLGNIARGATGWDPLKPPTNQDRKDYLALLGYYKKKYGTMEGFKQAMINEPATILSDLSLVFSGGAGAAAKIPRVAKVARAASKLDPVNMAYQTLAAPMRVIGKTSLPEKMWTSVAKPGKKFAGKEAAIFEESAKHKIMPTKRGLLGATGGSVPDKLIYGPYDEVTNIAKRATDEGVTIPKRDVIAQGVIPEIEQASKIAGGGGGVKTMMSRVSDFIERNGEVFTPDELLDIKRATSKSIGNIPWEQRAAAGVQAQKALENGMRRTLEKLDPSIAKLNKTVQGRKMLDEVVKDASHRISKNNLFGLTDYIVGTGGVGLAAAGRAEDAAMMAAIIGAKAILGNPAVKSRVAIALRRAAQHPVERIPGMTARSGIMATQRVDQDNR